MQGAQLGHTLSSTYQRLAQAVPVVVRGLRGEEHVLPSMPHAVQHLAHGGVWIAVHRPQHTARWRLEPLWACPPLSVQSGLCGETTCWQCLIMRRAAHDD